MAFRLFGRREEQEPSYPKHIAQVAVAEGEAHDDVKVEEIETNVTDPAETKAKAEIDQKVEKLDKQLNTYEQTLAKVEQKYKGKIPSTKLAEKVANSRQFLKADFNNHIENAVKQGKTLKQYLDEFFELKIGALIEEELRDHGNQDSGKIQSVAALAKTIAAEAGQKSSEEEIKAHIEAKVEELDPEADLTEPAADTPAEITGEVANLENKYELSSEEEMTTLVEEHAKDILEVMTNFDRASVQSRLEIVEQIINKMIYPNSNRTYIESELIDKFFDSLNLTLANLPDPNDKAARLNLRAAEESREAYHLLAKERNAALDELFMAGNRGIRTALEKLGKLDPADPLEIFREQDLSTLTEQERQLVLDHRNNAVTDYYLDLELRTIEASDETKANMKKLLVNEETGLYNTDKVAIRNEYGYDYLLFSSEAEMLYAMGRHDLVEFVEDENGNAKVQFKDETARAAEELLERRSALYVAGATNNKNRKTAILIYKSRDYGQTVLHEVDHKFKEEAELTSIEKSRTRTAAAMVEAFYSHVYPEYKTSVSPEQLTLERQQLIREVRNALAEPDKIAELAEREITELAPRAQGHFNELARILKPLLASASQEQYIDMPEVHIEGGELRKLLIKLNALAKHNRQEITAIKSESEAAKRQHVEGLMTKLRDNFARDNLMTLGKLGIKPEEFSIHTTDGELNQHAVESLMQIRFINSFLEANPDTDENLAKLVERWSARLASNTEFSRFNTLKFIYDVVENDDKIGFAVPSGEESLEQLTTEIESLETELAQNPEFAKYLFLNDEDKAGRLGLQAELRSYAQRSYDTDTEKDRERKLKLSYKLYLEQIKKGFTPDKETEVGIYEQPGDASHDYATTVNIRGLAALLQSEDWIHDYYSRTPDESPLWWGNIPILRTIMAHSDRGPANLAELGAVRDVRQIDPRKGLPLGLGEFKRITEALGLKKESDSTWKERLGATVVTKHEMEELFQVIYNNIAKALPTEAKIPQFAMIEMLMRRIGILHYDVEDVQQAAYGEMAERDLYIGKHLAESEILKASLAERGFSAAEITELMRAFDPKQKILGQDPPAGFEIKIGTVTDRMVKMVKKMRVFSAVAQGSNTKEKQEYFIEHGKRVDLIANAIMAEELNDQSYTLANIIEQIKEIERVGPRDFIGKKDKDGNPIDGLPEWKKQRKTVTINGQQFAIEEVKQFIKYFVLAKTYEATALGVFGEREVIKIKGKYYEVVTSTQLDDKMKNNILQDIVNASGEKKLEPLEQERLDLLDRHILGLKSTYNALKSSAATETDDAKKTALNHQMLQLLAELNHSKQEQQSLIIKKGGLSPEQFFSANRGYSTHIELREITSCGDKDVGKNENEIPQSVLDELDKLNEGETKRFRDPTSQLLFRSTRGLGMTSIEPFEGLDKTVHRNMFGEFTQLAGTDENGYALPDDRGKVVNPVEDTLFERERVMQAYFAYQLLIKQAEAYRDRSSKRKEVWVGAALLDQRIRWIWTILTIAALFTPAGALGTLLSAAFINPYSIGLLLADYFFIGKEITKRAKLWGKRKEAGIKAVGELISQEPGFEQALGDITFSSTRARERLEYIVKSGESILKGAKVFLNDIDVQENVLEAVTRESASTVKTLAST